MIRFFVTAEDIRGNSILLGQRNTSHIKALRLRVGEEIIVSDGYGTEYSCVFLGMENGIGSAEIVSSAMCASEPSVCASLYVAMPKGDKAELILQKAVELGAERICFFLSSRCISRPEDSAVKKRLERLARVSEEAAMQSGRGIIPEVRWLSDFRTMAEEAAGNSLGLFLWEEARGVSLRAALLHNGAGLRSVALVTGPEGGFSAEEAATAESFGLQLVTLGKRILRCETAPICALSALMYATKNLE